MGGRELPETKMQSSKMLNDKPGTESEQNRTLRTRANNLGTPKSKISYFSLEL